MDSQRLQSHLIKIQSYIIDFKEKLAHSQAQYQASIEALTDPELISTLMENRIIYTQRQEDAIAQMEGLCRQVQNQLNALTRSGE